MNTKHDVEGGMDYQCFHVGRAFLFAQFVVVVDAGVFLVLRQSGAALVQRAPRHHVHIGPWVPVVLQVDGSFASALLRPGAQRMHKDKRRLHSVACINLVVSRARTISVRNDARHCARAL